MNKVRPLRKDEADLISAMIRNTPCANEILRSLSTRLVEDMSDGAMGSVRFTAPDNGVRRFGRTVAEAEFTDDDGIVVNTAVNLDDCGDLFELDIWKTDFSSLKKYPRPENIRLKPPADAARSV